MPPLLAMWIFRARAIVSAEAPGGRPFFVYPLCRCNGGMPTTTIATTAEAIRERRLAAELTQRQLAVLADISLTTMSNIEAGLIPRNESPALVRILAALDEAERA
jgi:DNA-binding XRE family transcriptional regulator